jgi:lysophospholipase L1-like esterase
MAASGFTVSHNFNSFPLIPSSQAQDILNNQTRGVFKESKQVVFVGDSLTEGSYPRRAYDGLADEGNWKYKNTGVGGRTVVNMLTAYSSEVVPLYEPSIKNVLVFWGGINDIITGTPNTTTVYNNIVSYCTTARIAGWKVIVRTITPASDAGTTNANFEANRQTINTLIRDNYATFADALDDVGDEPIVGQVGDSDNTYYYIDKVHRTEAGYTYEASRIVSYIQSM